MSRVLIVGGGVAGCSLANSLAGGAGIASITLVEPKEFIEMYPGTTRALHCRDPKNLRANLSMVCLPLKRVVSYRVKIVHASVAEIRDGEVVLADGTTKLEWDVLCVATGSRMTDDQPWKGNESIRKFDDRVAQVEHYRADLEKASTVVVVGGGVIGVELVCDLAELYPKKTFHLLVAEDKLLVRFPPVFGSVARARLRRFSNVHIAFSCGRVVPSESGEYTFPSSDKRKGSVSGNTVTVKPDLVMNCFGKGWATSFVPPEWLDESRMIKVDKHLRVEGSKRVFAIGDCCSVSLDKSAKAAIPQAHVAARNIRAICRAAAAAARHATGDASNADIVLPSLYDKDPIGYIIGLGRREAVMSYWYGFRIVGSLRRGSYIANSVKRGVLLKLILHSLGYVETLYAIPTLWMDGIF